MYKYEEIVKDIEDSIANGSLKPNDKLPPVTELCASYSVSKSTINQVLQTLSDEGLVARRQGSGVYVKPIEKSAIGWQGANQVVQIAPRAAGMSETDSIHILDFNVIKADKLLQRLLGLSSPAFVYSIDRLHKSGSLVVCYEHVFVPIELVGRFEISDAAGNISEIIEDSCGIPIGSYQKTARAVVPTNAERAQLKIEYGAPVLEVETIGYLLDGKPFADFRKRYPGDRFEFRASGIDASKQPENKGL